MSPRPKGFAVLGSEAAREAGKKGGLAAGKLPRRNRPQLWTAAQAAKMSEKAVAARKMKALERARIRDLGLSEDPGVDE